LPQAKKNVYVYKKKSFEIKCQYLDGGGEEVGLKSIYAEFQRDEYEIFRKIKLE